MELTSLHQVEVRITRFEDARHRLSYSRIVEDNFGIKLAVKAFVREEPKGHAIQYIPSRWIPVSSYIVLHIRKRHNVLNIMRVKRNRKISLNMYIYLYIIYVYLYIILVYLYNVKYTVTKIFYYRLSR